MKAYVGAIDQQLSDNVLSDNMSKDCRFKEVNEFKVDAEDSDRELMRCNGKRRVGCFGDQGRAGDGRKPEASYCESTHARQSQYSRRRWQKAIPCSEYIRHGVMAQMRGQLRKTGKDGPCRSNLFG